MSLVSALVSTYNRAHFLDGAVETALGQTHPEMEVVIVDDDSDDRTPEVLERYRDHDRVTVARNDENIGIAATLNRAAELADGDYYCILDDDDRWHPEKVERQLDVFDGLDDSYGDVYTGGVLTVDGAVTQQYQPSYEGDIFPEVLTEYGMHPHSGHMYRADAFHDVGGYDPSFPQAPDWEFAIRMAKQYKFAYVDAPMVNRPVHDDNYSDSPEQTGIAKRIREKYAADLAANPDVERRFEAQRHAGRALHELRWGSWGGAVRHSAAALRREPSAHHSGLLAASVFGQHGFDAASRLRQLLTNREADARIEEQWWREESSSSAIA